MSDNAAAAAQRAGYSPRSAASLMAQEHIRETIRQHQEAAARNSGVSPESLIKEAEVAREVAEAAGNGSAMVAAIKLKAELTGLAADVPAPMQNADTGQMNVRETALAVLAVLREAAGGCRY